MQGRCSALGSLPTIPAQAPAQRDQALADDRSQWTALLCRGGKVDQALAGSLALKFALTIMQELLHVGHHRTSPSLLRFARCNARAVDARHAVSG